MHDTCPKQCKRPRVERHVAEQETTCNTWLADNCTTRAARCNLRHAEDTVTQHGFGAGIMQISLKPNFTTQNKDAYKNTMKSTNQTQHNTRIAGALTGGGLPLPTAAASRSPTSRRPAGKRTGPLTTRETRTTTRHIISRISGRCGSAPTH